MDHQKLIKKHVSLISMKRPTPKKLQGLEKVEALRLASYVQTILIGLQAIYEDASQKIPVIRGKIMLEGQKEMADRNSARMCLESAARLIGITHPVNQQIEASNDKKDKAPTINILLQSLGGHTQLAPGTLASANIEPNNKTAG